MSDKPTPVPPGQVQQVVGRMCRRIDVTVGNRQFIMYADRRCRIDDLALHRTTWYRGNQVRWWKRLQADFPQTSLAEQCQLDSLWLRFIAPANTPAHLPGKKATDHG